MRSIAPCCCQFWQFKLRTYNLLFIILSCEYYSIIRYSRLKPTVDLQSISYLCCEHSVMCPELMLIFWRRRM